MFVFDGARTARIGMAEAILCEGKTIEAIRRIVEELAPKQNPVLFTRLHPQAFGHLDAAASGRLDYDPESRTAFLNGTCAPLKNGCVAVVTAGTSDRLPAWEACRTLAFLGVEKTIIEDVGVAAIWRVQARIEEINRHEAVIVVAGMDGALASVLGGLSPRPVIAVPTSVGYGVARGGKAALNSMLASCAPGVAVVNIDNGYGAACAAFRIIQSLNRVSDGPKK